MENLIIKIAKTNYVLWVIVNTLLLPLAIIVSGVVTAFKDYVEIISYSYYKKQTEKPYSFEDDNNV